MNRLAIEILAFVILVGGAWAYGAHWLHDRDARFEKAGIAKQVQVEKDAMAKQKAIDDAKFAEAHDEHTKELGEIAGYNYAAGKSSVVCYSTSPASQVRTSPVFDSRNPPPGTVVTDDGLRPDIAGALKVYALGVARLQADSNQLMRETH